MVKIIFDHLIYPFYLQYLHTFIKHKQEVGVPSSNPQKKPTTAGHQMLILMRTEAGCGLCAELHRGEWD